MSHKLSKESTHCCFNKQNMWLVIVAISFSLGPVVNILLFSPIFSNVNSLRIKIIKR